MASAELSHRVGKVAGYPPLVATSDLQCREFREALLDVDTFEDLPGKVSASSLRLAERSSYGHRSACRRYNALLHV
jgi:hypothetical protein